MYKNILNWKLNNILLNNQWTQDVIREIRYYFKVNSSSSIHHFVSTFTGLQLKKERTKDTAEQSCAYCVYVRPGVQSLKYQIKMFLSKKSSCRKV